MLYAIIGDIHSNLTAFTAILEDIKQVGGVEKIWCLGDIVGYGPDPHECIALLRQTNHICVAGNHDWASIGKIDTSDFNPDAAAATLWTASQLSPDDTEFLKNLPLVVQEGDFTLVHGSPREPIWEYIMSTDVAKDNFTYFKSPYCLVGHSHVPLVYRENEGISFAQFSTNTQLSLGNDRLIINPGSVGQPRDGDPRASYAIYDSENRSIKLHRVSYDVSTTQARMISAGLPRRLITRLSYGM